MSDNFFINKLNDALTKEGVKFFASIPFEAAKVINPRLLPDDFEPRSVLLLAVPYSAFEQSTDGLNVGVFARCRDYHLFFKELYQRLLPTIALFHKGQSAGFADTSPIDEKDAALKAGIGFRGRNGLVTVPSLGSYIFIGSVLFENPLPTDAVAPLNGADAPYFSTACISCMKCIESCPTGALGSLDSNGVFIREKCLSHISQKRNKSQSEKQMLSKTKTLWGCDICQKVCPFNAKPSEACPDFFKNGYINNFSFELLNKMPENKFITYAFSYRERKVIVENFLTTIGDCDIIE